MATHRTHNSHQAVEIAEIDLINSESVIIDLSAFRRAPVAWDDGGVSWTIGSSGAAVSVKVEHSLMPEGFDDEKYWSEDENSPFRKGSEGNEHHRVQRIKFTASSGNPTIVVSSNAPFKVVI